MGSANATNAALKAARNIELLVELKGRQRDIGGIDTLLDKEGMGEYTVDFQADELPPVDASARCRAGAGTRQSTTGRVAAVAYLRSGGR